MRPSMSVPSCWVASVGLGGRWLGVDLGGGSIKVVVLADGTAIGRRTVALETAAGPDAVMAGVVAAARDALAEAGPVDAVGLAVPGLFDAATGVIELLPNLPGPWRGVPAPRILADALGVPAAIINDARAFTLAESRLGAAAGCATVAAYVLGTGIGGGLVVDGRLHLGRHGRAGELAHQIVEPGGPRCGCGNQGCLEAVAASRVLARTAGQPTALAAFAAAAAGDERAQAAIDQAVEHLGRAIANTVTAILPECVVVGGGVAAAGDALFVPLRAAVRRHVTLVPPDWYDVVPAALGLHAGAIGAALWATRRVCPPAGRP